MSVIWYLIHFGPLIQHCLHKTDLKHVPAGTLFVSLLNHINI